METNTYIEVIRRKSAAFTEAAARVSFDTTVPSCPGWRMRELVSHLGQAQEWSRQMVETRARERLPFQESRPVIEDDRLLSWFADQTVLLISALEGTDPAIPIWNWTGRGGVGFWARRQAHEAAVHCWDAHQAVGNPKPIDPQLAVDGANELLELLPIIDPKRFVGAGESIHLHAKDTEGEWMIRLGREGLEVSHDHAKGDAAGCGTASDIDLFLWGRVPLSALEVFGDAALLNRLQSLTAV